VGKCDGVLKPTFLDVLFPYATIGYLERTYVIYPGSVKPFQLSPATSVAYEKSYNDLQS
jgi:hypothetical protein